MSYRAACALCDYQVSARTEVDTAHALLAHIKTVHPEEVAEGFSLTRPKARQNGSRP